MKLTISKNLSTIVFSGLFSLHVCAHELIVKIDRITDIKGVMMIALYNSSEGYNSDTNTFSGKAIPVTQDNLTVNFGEVPLGDYAIKLYQDENKNGVIDKNAFGMPSEGYGFSNNGGAMGQPSFEDAKFSVKNKTAISIRLR